MYFAVCLMVFLASRGLAFDPLEERITRMEENMNVLMSWIEESFMKMTEEIQIMKTQNVVEIDDYVNDDDPNSLSSRIETPLNDKNLEERIHALESKMANAELVDTEVATLEDALKDYGISQLKAFVTQLDVRMMTLESQKGSNKNVTGELNELNQRVDALEEDVTDLHITVSNLDKSATGLEETIEGLNVAINDLESRVSDLEASENGNGTSEPTIAFSAYDVMTPIEVENTVVFPELDVNLGNGYNNQTGEFTVPPEGAGVYFLFFHTLVEEGELGNFYIARNGDPLCSAYGDHNAFGSDWPATSCGAVYILNEGKPCD